MIKLVEGDLFLSRAQVLAHGCNCAGKMGAGIAPEFKRRYPAMFQEYKRRCHAGVFTPGSVYLYKEQSPWVLNLATQATTGGARMEYVEACLEWIAENYAREAITSVAMPQIAAGLGGLDWGDVLRLLRLYLDPLPIPVFVYHVYRAGCSGDERMRSDG